MALQSPDMKPKFYFTNKISRNLRVISRDIFVTLMNVEQIHVYGEKTCQIIQQPSLLDLLNKLKHKGRMRLW